jgi:hypothetical protein
MSITVEETFDTDERKNAIPSIPCPTAKIAMFTEEVRFASFSPIQTRYPDHRFTDLR